MSWLLWLTLQLKFSLNTWTNLLDTSGDALLKIALRSNSGLQPGADVIRWCPTFPQWSTLNHNTLWLVCLQWPSAPGLQPSSLLYHSQHEALSAASLNLCIADLQYSLHQPHRLCRKPSAPHLYWKRRLVPHGWSLTRWWCQGLRLFRETVDIAVSFPGQPTCPFLVPH